MNPGNDSWHSPAGGPPSHPGMEQINQQPRPLGSFGYAKQTLQISWFMKLMPSLSSSVKTPPNKAHPHSPQVLFCLPHPVSIFFLRALSYILANALLFPSVKHMTRGID